MIGTLTIRGRGAHSRMLYASAARTESAMMSRSVAGSQLDRYVVWRLKRLLIKKRGRNLRAGKAGKWTSAWFHNQGLHQLMGTRYPKAA